MILTSYDEKAHMEYIRQEAQEELQEKLEQLIQEKNCAINTIKEQDSTIKEQELLIKQLTFELEKLKPN